MKESTVAQPLAMHWIPVVGASGETRLEAVWSVGAPAVPAHHAA